MKVSISVKAERDLQRIIDWIAADNPSAAVRFGDELIAKAVGIGSMPLAFPLAGLKRLPTYRKRTHRGYLIFYRVTRSQVVIARFVHASRDYSSFLGKS